MSKSKKWRDLQANPKIAFVPADSAPDLPGTARRPIIAGPAHEPSGYGIHPLTMAGMIQ